MKNSFAPFSLAASTLAGAQVSLPPGFEAGVKWNIEIQNTPDITKPLAPTDALVWDVDLYHVTRNPGVIDYLRSQNPETIVICYFNAGLAQESDCDYETTWKTPQYSGLLGNAYGEEWADEFWVNIKNQTARDLIKRRITLANDLGCDGVDPDNIDAYNLDEEGSDEKTGFDLTQQDDITFIRDLAAHAHSLTTSRGYTLLIGQKNAPELTPKVADVLDFAVLEDCKGLTIPADEEPYNFCEDYQEDYIEKGKPVFSIEYPTTLGDSETGECNEGGVTKAEYEASCDEGKGNKGFSTVLKIQGGEGELNGCTQYCDGKGLVVMEVDGELDGSACPKEAQGLKKRGRRRARV